MGAGQSIPVICEKIQTNKIQANRIQANKLQANKLQANKMQSETRHQPISRMVVGLKPQERWVIGPELRVVLGAKVIIVQDKSGNLRIESSAMAQRTRPRMNTTRLLTYDNKVVTAALGKFASPIGMPVGLLLESNVTLLHDAYFCSVPSSSSRYIVWKHCFHACTAFKNIFMDFSMQSQKNRESLFLFFFKKKSIKFCFLAIAALLNL